MIDPNSEIKELFDAIVESKQCWMETASDEMIAKKKADRNMITIKEFLDIFRAGKGKTYSDKIQTDISKVLEIESAEVIKLAKVYEIKSMQTRLSILIGLPISILLGFTILIFITFKVSARLSSVSSELKNLSQGLFNTANEVSDISEIIVHSSEQQASSLEEVSSSMV